MAYYVDLSKFWIDDYSISKAVEITQLDRRTLSSAKKGQLDRCQIDTLIKLQKLASMFADRRVTIEEMLIQKDD